MTGNVLFCSHMEIIYTFYVILFENSMFFLTL